MKRRVGVLISGSGTNLQALIDNCRRDDASAEIVAVISNRPNAYGLERARQAGIATTVVEHKAFIDRYDFEVSIDEVLARHGVDLVCLAGFMRVLTPWFVDRWRDRTLNIHPSLLPAFPGLHTHARALEAGVRAAGCTVHLVRSEVDTGPVLMQGLVPVLADDTQETLASRVLEVEHLVYPAALEAFAAGRLKVAGAQVVGDKAVPRLFLHPALRDG